MPFAVILAAGSSERFGAQDKLQVRLPDGRPLWRASFDALKQQMEVGVVCRKGKEAQFKDAAFVVPGGATRCESALIAAQNARDGIVLIHDAARPYPSQELITRVTQAAEQTGAAIPATPVTDTIKRISDGKTETLNRNELFAAQTPQAARRDWLLDALPKCPEATDEAMALERSGYLVSSVEGDTANIKVTTAADLDRMMDTSVMASVTGFGYDVHQFSDEAGRPLMLGGVRFPGERGLAGHSDADVILHAVTDALLGAVGLGDIGQLFPNTDPRWKNADSRIFLREAHRRLQESGGKVGSVDVTVVAENPKLGSKRDEIKSAIAQELGLSERNVNIKATTAEGLGALGRGEGIAAMAVATVLRPLEV